MVAALAFVIGASVPFSWVRGVLCLSVSRNYLLQEMSTEGLRSQRRRHRVLGDSAARLAKITGQSHATVSLEAHPRLPPATSGSSLNSASNEESENTAVTSTSNSSTALTSSGSLATKSEKEVPKVKNSAAFTASTKFLLYHSFSGSAVAVSCYCTQIPKVFALWMLMLFLFVSVFIVPSANLSLDLSTMKRLPTMSSLEKLDVFLQMMRYGLRFWSGTLIYLFFFVVIASILDFYL